MALPGQYEVEAMLGQALKVFCRNTFSYNSILKVDALVTFQIDDEPSLICKIEDSYPAGIRTKFISKQIGKSGKEMKSPKIDNNIGKESKPKSCAKDQSFSKEHSEKVQNEDELEEGDDENYGYTDSGRDEDNYESDNTEVYSPDLKAEMKSGPFKHAREQSLFTCKYCDIGFEEESRLKEHHRKHSGDSPYCCLKCGVRFKSAQGFKIHKTKNCVKKMNKRKAMAAAKKLNSHECKYCGRVFFKESRLVNHERMHTGERPYKCEKCGKSYVSIQGMKAHKIRGCSKPKEGSDKLKSPPPQIPCKYCGKLFSKRARLIVHERAKHTGERPFLCAICGKSFPCKVSLKQHNRLHTHGKMFTCTICNAKFSLQCNLKTHIRVHTGERPFVCWHCGRAFKQNGSLQIHMLTHTKEKPFKCSMCDLKFAHRSLLQKHENMHQGERKYACSVCGKKFWTDFECKTHAKKHLGLRNYVCPHCNVRFTQMSSLKRHVESHTGENRVHSCDLCGKTFTRSHQVKIHMRTHLKDSPFNCQKCGINFKSITMRNKHVESFHPGDPLIVTPANRLYKELNDAQQRILDQAVQELKVARQKEEEKVENSVQNHSEHVETEKFGQQQQQIYEEAQLEQTQPPQGQTQDTQCITIGSRVNTDCAPFKPDHTPEPAVEETIETQPPLTLHNLNNYNQVVQFQQDSFQSHFQTHVLNNDGPMF